MKFVLPLPLNLANSRIFWAKKHKLKLAYWLVLDDLQMVGKVPPPPQEPWQKAVLSHHWYLHGRHMDQGNCYNRLKWIEDWLVTRGYLVDDTPECLTLEKPVQETDRKNKRVEVTLRRDT